MGNGYTKEELLNMGKQALSNGVELKTTNAQEHGIHKKTIQRHFGSWNAFLRKLEVPVNKKETDRAWEEVRCKECDECFNGKVSKNRKYCSPKCSNKSQSISSGSYRNGNRYNECPRCEGEKYKKSDLCQSCRKIKNQKEALSKSISAYRNDNSLRPNSKIRKWGRKVLKRSDRKEECQVCGFDKIVEVSHLKPICEFSDHDLMSDVNNLENLRYLCPNHHRMFDEGLIGEEDVR
jgi:predicted restriction endonuclease